MRFSLEGRFPLLDHELVELAFEMPSRLKVDRGTAKYALREVARKFIVPECLSMRKRGFSMPLGELMRGTRNNLVTEKIEALKKRGLFRPEVVSEFVQDYRQGRRHHSQVWLLASIEMWMESMIDRQAG